MIIDTTISVIERKFEDILNSKEWIISDGDVEVCFFSVDEFPQGALARYEHDVAAIAHIIARRGAVPDQIQEVSAPCLKTFSYSDNSGMIINCDYDF